MAFLRIKAKKRQKKSFRNSSFVFLSRSEARINSIWCFWVTQKHEKTPFGLSESLRSIEKTPFGLSESLRSTKKLHLVFLSHSEARKNSICPFWVAQKHRNLLFPYLCRWQKRLFSLFCAYVVDRNTYSLFFMLMSLTEAFIFSFSCLCHWQKRLFSLFHAYVVDRSDYFQFLAFLKRSEA